MNLGGGQIWTQDDFPNFSVMLVPMGRMNTDESQWIMISDPRRHVGNMAIGWDHRTLWTTEDLEKFLARKTPFLYKGQLYDLIQDRWYKALCEQPPEER